jgi:hypothetical protein
LYHALLCTPAIGRSGGIIALWDANQGFLVNSFQGQGYVGVVLLGRRSAPAIGRSGGIITLWYANQGFLVDSFQGQG